MIKNLFKKKTPIDLEKQELYSKLSLSIAEIDRALLSKVLDAKDLIDRYRIYLNRASEQASRTLVSANEECELLDEYIQLFQAASGENFYVNKTFKIQEDELLFTPFLLFPMVQNALVNGYHSMPKNPIKIRINQTGQKIQLEVSNRVNHYVQNQGQV